LTISQLAQSLMRKSERALRSAQLNLQDGDTDSAVNRAYYAMFNAARAALLSAGVPEEELPRTHRGLISTFGQFAVQSGRVDSDLASALSRTETLRLKADYTGIEIEAPACRAGRRACGYVFSYYRASLWSRGTLSSGGIKDISEKFYEKDASTDPAQGRQQTEQRGDHSVTLSEQQRQGRENWLKLQREQTAGGSATGEHLRRDQSSDETHQSAGLEQGHEPPDDPGA
jgi:uncharacterized protein (UPF0332 family)